MKNLLMDLLMVAIAILAACVEKNWMGGLLCGVTLGTVLCRRTFGEI